MWYAGIDDALYQRIAIWHEAYWFGDTHSTRKYLSATGEIKDKVMKTAHEIPFREIELDHLVKMVGSLRPGTLLLEELVKIQGLWKYGKAVRGYKFSKSYWSKINLPQGSGIYRVILIAFYQEHIKEILDILQEAKTGNKITGTQKTSGKELFEE